VFHVIESITSSVAGTVDLLSNFPRPKVINNDQLSVLAFWYVDIRSVRWEAAMPENKSLESWEERYLQTIVEVNGPKMSEQITATRQAISGRLRDLEHDSDHHGERSRMAAALRALSVLEVEVQQW
jgi:hypothetical protein